MISPPMSPPIRALPSRSALAVDAVVAPTSNAISANMIRCFIFSVLPSEIQVEFAA